MTPEILDQEKIFKIPQELRQEIFNYISFKIDVVNERVLQEGKGFSQRLGLESVADDICLKIDEIFEKLIRVN